MILDFLNESWDYIRHILSTEENDNNFNLISQQHTFVVHDIWQNSLCIFVSPLSTPENLPKGSVPGGGKKKENMNNLNNP